MIGLHPCVDHSLSEMCDLPFRETSAFRAPYPVALAVEQKLPA